MIDTAMRAILRNDGRDAPEVQPQRKIPTMRVKRSEAKGPFVIALDVGSGASRGGLYDAEGRPVKGAKQRVEHAFDTGADGASTIDADQVVAECRQIIDGIIKYVRSNGLDGKVEGLIMDTFASSLVLVDQHYRALMPLMTYADSRCSSAIPRLKELVDEDAYHARTGVRLHTSYHPARLLWLKQEQPELFAQAHAALTLGEYVYYHLAKVEGIATAMAAWSGILNAHTGELDHEIFEAIDIDPTLIPEVCDPTDAIIPKDADLPESWRPVLSGVPWYHTIPDGWASNVGPGAVNHKTVAVAAATSGAMRVILPEVPEQIPEGLWCYRVSAKQCIIGGALNDVGRALIWLNNCVAPVDPNELAAVLAAGSDSPLLGSVPDVLPFFTGERATGWVGDARAAMSGISFNTSPLDVWRGVIEGISLSYARVWEQLGWAGAAPDRVIVSGGVTAHYPNWLHCLAGALQCPVVPLEMKRATLRGTALIALEEIQPGGERAVPPYRPAVQPTDAEYWKMRRQRFDENYGALVEQPRA